MLRNHSGFSLVSVLVALAMVGVLGMSLMSMMKNSSDMYQIAKARESADSTRYIANAVLQNADACKKSLIGAGLTLASIEANGGFNVKRIVSGKNAVVMTAGKADGPSEMFLEPLKQSRTIASLSDTRYLGQLRMKFDDKKTPDFGGGVNDRILPISLTLNGNTIVGCKVGAGDEPDVDPDNPHDNPKNCKSVDNSSRSNYYEYDRERPSGGTVEGKPVTDEVLLATLKKNEPPKNL